MKTKILLVCTFVILLQVSWAMPLDASGSKPCPVIAGVKKPVGNFTFFRTHRQGQFGVGARWGVNSTQGITCFVLQRTYEFPDEYAMWENVTEISCHGNSYDYVDGGVFPGNISYRVVAMNAGSVAFVSVISAVQIRQR